jgi:hypothetical protein
VLADEALGEEIEGDVEGAGLCQEGGDVLEEDARLGEVRDLTDLGAQVLVVRDRVDGGARRGRWR